MTTFKKPHVNSTCIWCSMCVSTSEEVFSLNEEGLSIVKNMFDYNNKNVDDAIAVCPVNAISWQEADSETWEYEWWLKEHD